MVLLPDKEGGGLGFRACCGLNKYILELKLSDRPEANW